MCTIDANRLRKEDIAPEAFKSQAGDYLGVAYALQIADMLAHHPFMFTSLASEAKQEGRLDKANVEQYKVMVAKELFGKIADFLQTRVKTNPPPVAKSIIYAGSYDSPIDGDIAEQYLEVKKKHNGQLFIPIEESDATVTLVFQAVRLEQQCLERKVISQKKTHSEQTLQFPFTNK